MDLLDGVTFIPAMIRMFALSQVIRTVTAIAPVILSIVLGKVIEKDFLITMIKHEGGLLGFFERPVAAVLGVTTLMLWSYLILSAFRRSRRAAALKAGKGG